MHNIYYRTCTDIEIIKNVIKITVVEVLFTSLYSGNYFNICFQYKYPVLENAA